MQLEFATMPPYLCAQCSIKSDPDGVGDLIQNMAVQEMFHFALVGNILTAIGGAPNIAKAEFLPPYPTHVLPGGISQQLVVDLQPLSLPQLEVFMQIELPEFPPVALNVMEAPATIGAFYTTLSVALGIINPPIDLNAHFVNMGEAVQIKTIADAQAAIARIKAEGEGTQGHG
jgi:ferritin-like protein